MSNDINNMINGISGINGKNKVIREVYIMTDKQREIIDKKLILLDIEDVVEITGWCTEVVRNTFANDGDFPAIKKGKKYQVELEALKKYLEQRRVKQK